MSVSVAVTVPGGVPVTRTRERRVVGEVLFRPDRGAPVRPVPSGVVSRRRDDALDARRPRRPCAEEEAAGQGEGGRGAGGKTGSPGMNASCPWPASSIHRAASRTRTGPRNTDTGTGSRRCRCPRPRGCLRIFPLCALRVLCERPSRAGGRKRPLAENGEESVSWSVPLPRRSLRSQRETSFSPGPGRLRRTEPRSPGGDLVPPRETPAPARAPVRTWSQVPAATCHPDRASVASERRDLPRLRRTFGFPKRRLRSGDPSTSRGCAPLRSG